MQCLCEICEFEQCVGASVKQVWRQSSVLGQGSHPSRLGRWPPPHYPSLLCTASPNYPLTTLVHCPLCRLPLVTAKSKSKDLSPGKRGRRPGTARGLLQRPGKLLEIQTSSLLWDFSGWKMRRNSRHIVDAQNPTPTCFI